MWVGGERERETVQLAEDSMPSKVHFNMYVCQRVCVGERERERHGAVG